MTSAHVIGFIFGLVAGTLIWAWVVCQWRAGVMGAIRENQQRINKLIADQNASMAQRRGLG